jgi:hypothetical protein
MINLSVKNANLLVSNLGLLEGQKKTRLIADSASGSSTISVAGISGFAISNYVLIGTFGDSSAEIIKIHASTAPTGSTITLASNTTKDHFSDSEVTLLDYNQVEFSRSTTLAGAKVVLGSVQSINADRLESYYKDLTNTTGYAFARFKNEALATFSGYSTGVSYSGNGNTSVEKIVERACQNASVEIGGEYSTENMLLNDANDCQDAITSHDWKFELVKNDTSLTATQYENTYALSSLTYALKYPGIAQGIKSVKFANAPLQYVDNNEMDDLYKSVKRTAVATQAEIAATSIVLDNTSELSEESGTVYINGMTLAYTGNDKTTNTLSGISASAITAIIPVDSIVWQNLNPGLPTKYTITIDNELVFDRPVLSDYNGYSIKMEYLKALTRFTDFSSTTEIPFTDFLPIFIEAKIEKRKRNFENHKTIMQEFDSELKKSLEQYKLPILDGMRYYNFFDYPTSTI